VTPRHDSKLSIHLQDIDNFRHEWDVDSLPWDAVTPIAPGDEHPEQLDERLVAALNKTALDVIGSEQKAAHGACLAFLYLYMILNRNEHYPAFNFMVRSTLPVGAGLGSSASYSVCAATASLLVHRRLELPSPPVPSSSNHVHVSHQGRRAIPPATADEINRWAFVAEKILHGNPSGVDNSVAVFGGALAYTRPGFGKKSGMEGIQGFKSLKFLLTNSKVPRDTKKLVAGVGQKKANEPELVNGILEAIQSISDEARRTLADPELPRDALLSALSGLMKENHEHLVTLGVSHPSLETIREKTASPHGLTTKLTGAGGGGCAVTLIPDDFKDEHLQDLISTLIRENFQPYLTSVGGSGLGILSPYPEHRNYGSGPYHATVGLGQVTPSDTPTPRELSPSQIVDGSEKGSDDLEPLHTPFLSRTVAELPVWASELGRWMYV